MQTSFKTFLWALLVVGALSACGRTAPAGEAADSLAAADEALEAIDVAPQASVGELTYTVEHWAATTGDDRLADTLRDEYAAADGVLTFRGGLQRTADFGGRVSGEPQKIVCEWTYTTDKSETWGGGSGWTGQPLVVHWSDAAVERMRAGGAPLTADFSNDEIIVGSLCGKIYFLNAASGRASREPLDAGNPVKGTVSLDPRALSGEADAALLFVGQGVPDAEPFGCMAFDLYNHERVFFQGRDAKAYRGWGAYDSSPVRVGDYVFWPGENGSLYKFSCKNRAIVPHSTLRYLAKGDTGAGIENSLCVYRNLGFFGDNHGDVVGIDLRTLQPLWHYDVGDDVDGTLVCEVEDGVPFVYVGCEVDRQGERGNARFVKLNGLTGEKVWGQSVACWRVEKYEKHFDGGLYCTPLLGRGDCDSLVFFSMCNDRDVDAGTFYALERATGRTAYTVALEHYAWSSPIGFLNEEGRQFIVVGDTQGRLYLLEGKTGRRLFCSVMGANFESSPAIVDGRSFVVGSRGDKIYRFRVE